MGPSCYSCFNSFIYSRLSVSFGQMRVFVCYELCFLILPVPRVLVEYSLLQTSGLACDALGFALGSGETPGNAAALQVLLTRLLNGGRAASREGWMFPRPRDPRSECAPTARG